jgi:hypothetical protein
MFDRARKLSPTERLVLMSLHHTPYQTSTELARSTGSGTTQLNAATRTLEMSGQISGKQNELGGPIYYHPGGDWDDDPMDRGGRAIAKWRGTLAPGCERGTPEQEVLTVLSSALIDEWGRALPDGLALWELEWATRFNREQVIEALDGLRVRSERGDRHFRLVEGNDANGQPRYRLKLVECENPARDSFPKAAEEWA